VIIIFCRVFCVSSVISLMVFFEMFVMERLLFLIVCG